MNFTIYILLTMAMFHTKNGNNWSSSFEKKVKNLKLFTHDAQHQAHDAR